MVVVSLPLVGNSGINLAVTSSKLAVARNRGIYVVNLSSASVVYSYAGNVLADIKVDIQISFHHIKH